MHKSGYLQQRTPHEHRTDDDTRMRPQQPPRGSGRQKNQQHVGQNQKVKTLIDTTSTCSRFKSFEFIIQGLPAHAQLPGSGGQVAFVLLDGRFDGLPLHLFQLGDDGCRCAGASSFAPSAYLWDE